MSSQMSLDFEQLSAYVDNQLSPGEKAALEARLAAEPGLAATLDDLRRTVSALRSLPLVKPPRSFTLTPQQVGARARRGPLFPVFRLAAALCTLLLAFAVARDLTTSSLGASATQDRVVQSSAGTPLAAPNVAVLATSTAEGSQEAYGASALVPTATVSADLALTPVVHFAPAGTDATPTGGAQRFTATAVATSKEVAATETPADTAVSVAALSPNATESPTPNLVPPPSAATSTDWRLVEVVLAGLALAAAAAAWFTRRG